MNSHSPTSALPVTSQPPPLANRIQLLEHQRIQLEGGLASAQSGFRSIYGDLVESRRREEALIRLVKELYGVVQLNHPTDLPYQFPSHVFTSSASTDLPTTPSNSHPALALARQAQATLGSPYSASPPQFTSTTTSQMPASQAYLIPQSYSAASPSFPRASHEPHVAHPPQLQFPQHVPNHPSEKSHLQNQISSHPQLSLDPQSLMSSSGSRPPASPNTAFADALKTPLPVTPLTPSPAGSLFGDHIHQQQQRVLESIGEASTYSYDSMRGVELSGSTLVNFDGTSAAYGGGR
ncbi:hypothetical protein T439DRAFT_370442 [Meredithblackwellia eburnea MCA 4105]